MAVPVSPLRAVPRIKVIGATRISWINAALVFEGKVAHLVAHGPMDSRRHCALVRVQCAAVDIPRIRRNLYRTHRKAVHIFDSRAFAQHQLFQQAQRIVLIRVRGGIGKAITRIRVCVCRRLRVLVFVRHVRDAVNGKCSQLLSKDRSLSFADSTAIVKHVTAIYSSEGLVA